MKKVGIKIPFGKDDYDIKIPKDVAEACEELGRGIVKGVTMGYREVKHIRRLTKGAVILDKVNNGSKRFEATMEDFEKVKKVDYLFGEQFNPLRPPEGEVKQ